MAREYVTRYSNGYYKFRGRVFHYPHDMIKDLVSGHGAYLLCLTERETHDEPVGECTGWFEVEQTDIDRWRLRCTNTVIG